MPQKVKKSEEEWKKTLSPEAFYVLRKKGTDIAFSGRYVDTKSKGIYVCAGCGNALFSSDAKFDSGTGWPSFSATVAKESIELKPDTSHGMTRTEVVCRRCGGHLGHVFDDGPMPTDKRFCINSAALHLKK